MAVRKELGHKQAQQIIDAVGRALDERSAGAAVAVVDPHGELVSLLRTDGCPLASINNAINKAFTAAREKVDSGVVGQRSRDEGFPMTNFGDPRYTGWGGGLPITDNGEVVGAIGVSGLSEQEDIELARIGLAAVTGTN